MKKVVIILLCFAPVPMRAQSRRSLSKREIAEGFVSFFPAGPCSMPNRKLNEWAASYGKTMSPSVTVADLFNLYAKLDNNWYGGMAFGMIISNQPLISAYYFDFTLGHCLFTSQRFQSNLNLNLIEGKSLISNDIVPRSVTNPQPGYVIQSTYIGAGFSSSNYLTMYKWKNGRCKLALGMEYGITFIGQTPWVYGKYSSHSSGSSSSVSVPEVPSMDPYFTYMKFSLALRF